jgi:hypothetical protein
VVYKDQFRQANIARDFFQELSRCAVGFTEPVPHVDPVIIVADKVTVTSASFVLNMKRKFITVLS